MPELLDLNAPAIQLEIEGYNINYNYNINHSSLRVTTQDVTVSSYRDAEFDAYCNLLSDNRVCRYYDSGNVLTKDEMYSLIENGAKRMSAGQPYGIFSIYLNEDHSFAGMFDFLPFSQDKSIIELGIALSPNHQCKGVAREVAYFFSRLYPGIINSYFLTENDQAVRYLLATAHPRNFPSIRLIRSLGFNYIGSATRFDCPREWYLLEVSEFTKVSS